MEVREKLLSSLQGLNERLFREKPSFLAHVVRMEFSASLP
jgi:hypothetical protein